MLQRKKLPFPGLLLSLLLSLLLAACSPAQPTPAAPSSGTPVTGTADDMLRGLAEVQRIDIFLLESFPVQVRVQAAGLLPDACTTIDSISSERQEDTFFVTLTTARPVDALCATVKTPFTENIPVDAVGLPAGVYVVVVNGVRGSFQLQIDNSPQSTDGPTPSPLAESAGPDLPDATLALAAAANDLARQLGLEPAAITVISAEAEAWSDSCLGLGLANESCLQAITPGFRITLQAGAQTYLYRSDDSGQILRQEVTTTPSATAPACSNRAEFVRDVTVGDNTRIQPGESFTKTWRLRNTGNCTWTTAYTVVFDSGDQLSGPDVAALPAEVPPGRTVDLSVSLVAPLKKGQYQSFWKLRSGDGQVFGLGERDNRAFWVLINVPVTITPTPASSGAGIRGLAWHDLCSPGGAATPPGCVVAPDGTLIANGLLEPGEPHIAGMEVSLGEGPCPAAPLRVAIADAAGLYTFDNLDAGVYCVSIDILSPHNLPIFIPGAWTYPASGIGEQTVTLGSAAVVENVNFGWDYQFAP